MSTAPVKTIVPADIPLSHVPMYETLGTRELFLKIVMDIPIVEILALSRCCKWMRRSITDRRLLALFGTVAAARIEGLELLSKYFPNSKDSADFLSVLHRHDAVLSGSFVIQCLLSTVARPFLVYWSDSDVDIFATAIDSRFETDPLRHRCVEMYERSRIASIDLETRTCSCRGDVVNTDDPKLMCNRCKLRIELWTRPAAAGCIRCASGRFVVCPKCGFHQESEKDAKFEEYLCELFHRATPDFVDHYSKSTRFADAVHTTNRIGRDQSVVGETPDSVPNHDRRILGDVGSAVCGMVPASVMPREKLTAVNRINSKDGGWSPLHPSDFCGQGYDTKNPWEYAIYDETRTNEQMSLFSLTGRTCRHGFASDHHSTEDDASAKYEQLESLFPCEHTHQSEGAIVRVPIDRFTVLRNAYDFWTPIDRARTMRCLSVEEFYTDSMMQLKDRQELRHCLNGSKRTDGSSAHSTAEEWQHCSCEHCKPVSFPAAMASSGAVDLPNPRRPKLRRTEMFYEKSYRNFLLPENFVRTFIWPMEGVKTVDDRWIQCENPSAAGRFNVTIVRLTAAANATGDRQRRSLMSPYETLRSHVRGFDLDICQNLFDGRRLVVGSLESLIRLTGRITSEKRLLNRFNRERLANRVKRYRGRGFDISSPRPELIRYLTQCEQVNAILPPELARPPPTRKRPLAAETVCPAEVEACPAPSTAHKQQPHPKKQVLPRPSNKNT